MLKADGAAGARRASALLGIAACAETTHTTLDEDMAKVDMKISFRHAFKPKKLVTIHVQVKSGSSYLSDSSNVNTLTLNIDKETLAALYGEGVPGVIVWVPPKPFDRLYWYSSDPRRPMKTPAKVSRLQYVRPSIRYDLTRLSTYAGWSRAFSRQTVSQIDDSKIRKRAKEEYSILKQGTWSHPLLGNVAVTRFAWRHVTRRSKSRSRRILALRIVPHLKKFLETSPDRYVLNQGEIRTIGRLIVETRHVLCWYRGALSIGTDTYSLLLRINERISFPSNWQDAPLSTADISQTSTLASWWCKKEK